jgi:hypothetical protein
VRKAVQSVLATRLLLAQLTSFAVVEYAVMLLQRAVRLTPFWLAPVPVSGGSPRCNQLNCRCC